MKTPSPHLSQPGQSRPVVNRRHGSYLRAGLAYTLFIAPQLALAQAEKADAGNYMVQTTLGLGFVLLLLMALLWVMKRSGFSPGQRAGGFYKVIASSSLGPRERIVLVEVGDTWLMLGMTQHSINTLHTMPKGSLDINNKDVAAQTFANMLDKFKQHKTPSA